MFEERVCPLAGGAVMFVPAVFGVAELELLVEGNAVTWGDGLGSCPRVMKGPVGMLGSFPRLFEQGEVLDDDLGVEIEPGLVPDSSRDGAVLPELVIVILPVEVGSHEIVDLPEVSQQILSALGEFFQVHTHVNAERTIPLCRVQVSPGLTGETHGGRFSVSHGPGIRLRSRVQEVE